MVAARVVCLQAAAALAIAHGNWGDGRVANGITAGCWSTVAVVLSTVASQTIFGLRRDVQGSGDGQATAAG